MNIDPDKAAKEVMESLGSTPAGRAAMRRLDQKDRALGTFQQVNGVSEEMTEAAIKEWVTTHGGNLKWDFEDVKVIGLRNKQDGVPQRWLPEEQKAE